MASESADLLKDWQTMFTKTPAEFHSKLITEEMKCTLSSIVYLFKIYIVVTLVFVIIPSLFHYRMGLSKLYLGILRRLFSFSRGEIERKLELKRSKSDSDLIFDHKFDRRGGGIIAREADPALLNKDKLWSSVEMDYMIDLCKLGVESIVDDDVTRSFLRNQPEMWNLLSRNDDRHYKQASRSLTLYWMLGVLLRYFIFLPFRLNCIFVGFVCIIMSATVLSWIPQSTFKEELFSYIMKVCSRILLRGTVVADFHDLENRPSSSSIAVCNHTDVNDVIVLHMDHSYAVIGMRHSRGLISLFEYIVEKVSNNYIWFDRHEQNDRRKIVQRLQSHCKKSASLPLLIFPEGYCINNTALFMFKKGSFETDSVVYPVAIKYDSQFGDPFWSEDSFTMHILSMATSWMLVADVWYLPPQRRRDGESSAVFAHRVKKLIAARAGLKLITWDAKVIYRQVALGENDTLRKMRSKEI